MLDKSSRRIRDMFASIAPRYDLANRLLSLRSDVLWRRQVSRTLLDRPGRVLDLAAGTGDLTADLSTQGAHRVVAVDLTFEMLAVGREKYRRRAQGSQLLNADALELPFRDDSFDGVTVAFGIRNFSDPSAGLAEMRRVVRTGGAVGVLEFSKPGPALNLIYQPYMKHLLPALGGLITGSRAPYQYLADSISSFPHGEAFLSMMGDAGLGSLSATALSGGIATFYRGEKS